MTVFQTMGFIGTIGQVGTPNSGEELWEVIQYMGYPEKIVRILVKINFQCSESQQRNV